MFLGRRELTVHVLPVNLRKKPICRIGEALARSGAVLLRSAVAIPSLFLSPVSADTPAASQPARNQAVEIAAGAPQLFADDFLIASSDGLKRTLHQPIKDDGGNTPVLALEKEFDGFPGMLHANGTILFDPALKKYVMFARATAHDAPLPPADRRRIYRFTSPDGLHWIKGDDGTPQRIAIDLSDPDAGFTNIDLFSCWLDTADSQRPYKGWLYIHGKMEGVYYMSSVDGRQWERGKLVIAAHQHIKGEQLFRGPEDVTTFHRDPLENRFLGLFKFHLEERLPNKNLLRSRAYAFFDRLDEPFDLSRIGRVDLVPRGTDAGGDKPTDEYYAADAWRCGPLWLGAVKVWHRETDRAWSAAGCAFLKLAVSRDGLHWSKVPFANDVGIPEVFVANGPEGGNDGRNDGGYMCLFSQGPLLIGDELIYYYGASSLGKNKTPRLTGGGIFRARLRPDGFVSVDEGTLTTRPMVVAGNDLLVNSIGKLTVEALAADGKALGKAEINGDSLRHSVAFDGRKLRELSPGGTARLRFTLGEGGRLYSFTVQ